jgi:secondary thiamine-phosphate synthase enzyme
MELLIKTNKRNEIIDISDKLREIVYEKFCDKDKACLVYTPHTTCGILVQENYDPDVCIDILSYLDKNIPNIGFLHREGNSDSHIKASLIGPSKIIPVKDKKLLLGEWQGVMLCEFDGPRSRRVKVINLS